jgi:hypothetical protein
LEKALAGVKRGEVVSLQLSFMQNGQWTSSVVRLRAGG